MLAEVAPPPVTTYLAWYQRWMQAIRERLWL